jgi:hypothetical protein
MRRRTDPRGREPVARQDPDDRAARQAHPDPLTPPAGWALALQRGAGNRAATGALARQREGPGGDAPREATPDAGPPGRTPGDEPQYPGTGSPRSPVSRRGGPWSIDSIRRGRRAMSRRQALVLIRYSHDRSELRPSASPRQAPSNDSCSASSASWVEPSIR